MLQTRYGTSYWVARLPAKRRPTYPRQRGDAQTEVAIIGGGFAGCACAYALAVHDVRVVLLEAGALGQAATAESPGMLLQDPDIDYQVIEAHHGRRAAHRIYQVTRRGMLDLAKTIRRLKIRCDLDTQNSICFTTSSDEVRRLRHEYALRRAAGLEASWLTAQRLRRETALTGEAGLLTKDSAHVDPYRACLGLAAAAQKRGALVYERSPVMRTRFDAKGVEVKTLRGTIRATRVVVATGDPSSLFRPLIRHFRLTETYVVATPSLPAPVRAELGGRAAILQDTAAPSHWLRWTRDDRILFAGADQLKTALRSRERILVQRAGQLMYELSRFYPVISGIRPEFAWRCPIVRTVDGLPFIGPHRNYPHHLFALGYGMSGLTMGFLASRLLLRHYLDRPAKGDELFGFMRFGGR